MVAAGVHAAVVGFSLLVMAAITTIRCACGRVPRRLAASCAVCRKRSSWTVMAKLAACCLTCDIHPPPTVRMLGAARCDPGTVVDLHSR